MKKKTRSPSKVYVSSAELTAAQKELYQWLKSYIAVHGRSPSYREIMAGLKLKSLSSVQSRLKCLKEKGYVAWRPGERGSLRLLKEKGWSIAIDIGGEIIKHKIMPYEKIRSEDIVSVGARHDVYAFRVKGDDLNFAGICDDDLLLFSPVKGLEELTSNSIVLGAQDGKELELLVFTKDDEGFNLDPLTPNPLPSKNDECPYQVESVLIEARRASPLPLTLAFGRPEPENGTQTS